MVTLDLRAEVEIWPFRACAMHPAIIIGTVCSLWTWLWGRYHVPQNVFLVLTITWYKWYFVMYYSTLWSCLFVLLFLYLVATWAILCKHVGQLNLQNWRLQDCTMTDWNLADRKWRTANWQIDWTLAATRTGTLSSGLKSKTTMSTATL